MLYIPFLLRKSGTPQLTLIPAPVINMMLVDDDIFLMISLIELKHVSRFRGARSATQ
jgi:hypothetical protein